MDKDLINALIKAINYNDKKLCYLGIKDGEPYLIPFNPEHIIIEPFLLNSYVKKNGKKWYEKNPEQLYSLSVAHCSNSDCSVGKPKQACVDNGCYSENKCACYDINNVDFNNMIIYMQHETQLFKLIKELGYIKK